METLPNRKINIAKTTKEMLREENNRLSDSAPARPLNEVVIVSPYCRYYGQKGIYTGEALRIGLTKILINGHKKSLSFSDKDFLFTSSEMILF